MAIELGRSLLPVRIRGIPRLYYLCSRLLFKPGMKVLDSASGIRVAGDPRDYFSAMMLFGRYAPDVLGIVDRFVRKGNSVLDIGAQAGYITSHLALRVGPTGQVHSFEPDPNALPFLELTLEANGFDWVRVFRVAAADREGTLDFHVSKTLGWSTAVAETHLTDLKLIEVPCVRIDDLRTSGQIRRPVHFVKIDVEGFECSVLDGMHKLLEEDRPVLVCEVNPQMLIANGNSAADLAARVTRHGYQLFRVRERTGVFNGGRVDLEPFEAAHQRTLCDVLCIPEQSVV